MATWNPIRIPNFIADKRLSKQPSLTADSLLSRPSPLEPMREVKRNPFPAKLLKSKTATYTISTSASSRSCEMQVFDLARRACNTVTQISCLRSLGTLRRSRFERKEDWDMAMFWLMDGHATLLNDKIYKSHSQRAIPLPILDSILLPEDCRPKLCFTELPVMLLIPPRKKISMLSVESNMCFDLEFLKSLSEDTCSPQWQGHSANENSHFTSILNRLEQSTSKKLIDCSQEMRVESPAMKSTAIEKYCSTGKLKRGRLQSICGSGFLPILENCNTALNVLGTTGPTSEEQDMAELKNLERYKSSFWKEVASVESTTRRFEMYSTSPIDSRISWSQGIVDAHLLKEDDVKQAYCFANDIDKPILLRTILVSDGETQERRLTREAPIPAARPINMCSNDLLESLSDFRRSLFSSESSMWGRASKEVMSRAKYKRRRLLSSQSNLVSLILSSGQFPDRLTAALSVGCTCEVLDSLVFSRLQVVSAYYHGKKSRTAALLDRLDFVVEGVAKSRQQFLNKCCQNVKKMLRTYDPPTRKWSHVHFEKILSRYESSKPCSGEVNGSQVGKESPLEDYELDSDESVLDDFVLSDEELDGQKLANGFGMLEEIREDLRYHEHLKTSTQARNAEGPQNENGDRRGLNVGARKKLKVRLKVPDALVCAPWIIQVAEQCVKTMPRGSVFVPPPLSVLPIVALVTSTHLRDSVRDQRVVVVCESQADVTDCIREYLQSSLGESISIDSIRRSEYNGVEGVAPLPHSTARVVVLDSFCFSFSIGFSLLVVLVVRDVGGSVEDVRLRHKIFDSDVSPWVRIPFMLLAPLDAWVGLQQYITTVRHMSTWLRAKDVLWVKAKDDVYDSIAISSPRVVYLAPSRKATHLASLLEAHAAPYLQAYVSQYRMPIRQTAKKISTLQDVDLRFVRETIQDTNGDNSGRSQRLELLYTFRQARTFAMYDGFDTAVAYLEHCSKHSQSLVRRAVSKLLKELDDPRDGNASTGSTHPIVKALTKCLREAEKRMLQEPPSLRSVHRRDRFRPLIIANSQEAVAGCLQGLEDAALLENPSKRGITVCALQAIKTTSKRTHREKLREKLEEFSHVYHLVDDRYDVPSDLLLPPSLLHHVHAGRTRLMTIVVDETRNLDEKWEQEFSFYDKFSTNLEKEEFGDVEYGAPYLQQTSVESLWSAAKNTLPGCEDLEIEMAQPSKPNNTDVNVPYAYGFVQQKPGTLFLSSHEVCSSTVENLRATLSKHLVTLPTECLVLRVFVHIHPNESCSPAVTYLHSALAGNETLQQKVVVDTVFLF